MTRLDARVPFLSAAMATLLFGLLTCATTASFAQETQQDEAAARAEFDAKIAELIQKLGDERFVVRQKAQNELEKLGLEAFDALFDAQNHEDVEIAMRSRYLVRSLRVNWDREDDAPEVKRILRGYGGQHEAERKNRMERLSLLAAADSIPALCRLVRFEASGILSKQAALVVMNLKLPEDPTQRAATAESIRKTIGLSKRPGSRWLAAYAMTLDDAESSLKTWAELTKEEIDTHMLLAEKTRSEIVRDLVRWRADLLLSLNHESEAIEAMRQSIDLVDATQQQFLETVDWLMQRKAWSVVDDMAQQYAVRFDEDPLLLYRLAESKLQQGKNEEDEAISQRAVQLAPDDPDAHVVMAYSLQERGLLRWAESEYRGVIKASPAGSLHDMRARLLLSELLHDTDRELPAAEVLKPAVELMEKDPAVADLVRKNFGREPGSVASRMHFFYARQAETSGDAQQVIERLSEAIKADPTDADVLIAMHRVEKADEAWKERTLKQIEAATGHFRDQIAEYEQQAENARSEPIRAWAERNLASAHNQFAWLVSNTVGDYDAAIRSSHKSLELRPDTGGYYDTLGRCYYAKKDLENALKYQRRAAELEPHSGQIRAQLELFEKDFAASQKEKQPQP